MPRKVKNTIIQFCLLAIGWVGTPFTSLSADAYINAPLGSEENCAASFLFAHLDGSTFTFHNTSDGFTGFSWDFDGQLVTPPVDQISTTYTFDSDTSTVCLYIWNDQGCTDTFCLEVYEGSPDELCENTDCVYPGDANGNRRANNYDLLNIGLGFGELGPPRPFFPDPSDPNTWAPNFSYDWDDFAGPVNFKHLDCDGDGIVTQADLIAIEQNYEPESDVPSAPTVGAPQVYLAFEQPEIQMTANMPDSIELIAHLYVGDADVPVQDFYGMGLQLSYDDELTVGGVTTATYDASSFMGGDDEVLHIGRDLHDFDKSEYDYAVSRNDGFNVDGYGSVATFSFIVVGDIIEGKVLPEVPYEVGLQNLILRSASGDTLEYDLGPPAIVTFLNNNEAVEDTTSVLPEFELMPNPAHNWVLVRYPQSEECWITIYDPQGRLQTQQRITADDRRINLTRLGSGLYFVELRNSKGRRIQRLLVD